nr:hypothetical protein [Tanacetum cinerariifolium]
MDRNTWMYNVEHFTANYMKGLSEFMKCAEDHRERTGETKISCPCKKCRNIMSIANPNMIRRHLIEQGFDKNYTCWDLHGEPRVDSHTFVSDTHGENDSNDDNHRYNLDEMLHDVESSVAEKNVQKLQQLFVDAEKPLYNVCKKFTNLYLVVKLLDLKAKSNWSDKSFTALLELLHEAFLEDNELPVLTYQAKKRTCLMGLEVQRIHACLNDCILYRKEYKYLHKCHVCMESRYKHKNLTKLSSDVTKNCPHAKLLWYLPIIPRLKKLYANPKDAKLLRWHSEERKNDGKMRHVADSPQWKNIDHDFKKFGSEIRNLRFGLCSDGINPFKSLSSRHSTWPVLLCIYNLPPWMCMKRKYIMMSLLIQGQKQSGNDIDVYVRPLNEDMKDLWETCVEIYDAYKKESFQLFAMIYCTINDFPAYGNLSGYGTKGEKACPISEKDTHSQWLTNCRKTIYMGCRRSLDRYHPYRKKKKLFDGTIENRSMAEPLNGYAALSQVADLNIIFKKKVKDPPKRLLLNIPGKTKDGVNARKDIVEMGIRNELAPQVMNGTKMYLPTACYTLSKAEKTIFCDCLHGVKVPSGYSANIRKLVLMKGLKLLEIKYAAPVFLQYVYPFERYMGYLKGYVRNRYRPEGSIVQGYAFEEVVQFCTNYMDDVAGIRLLQPRHQGRLVGVGTIRRKDVSVIEEIVDVATLVPRIGVTINFALSKLHLVPDIRGTNYCLARAPRDKNGIKALPPELINVSKNLEIRAELKAELWNEKQAEQNLFSPRQDDVPILVQMRYNLSSTTSMVRNEKKAQQNESFSPRQDDVPTSVQRRSNLSLIKSIVRKEQQGEQNESISTRQVDVPSSVHRRSNLSSTTSIVKLHCIKGLSKTPVSGVPTKRVMHQHENAHSTKKKKGNKTPKEPNKQDKALKKTTKHQKTMQKIDEVKELLSSSRGSVNLDNAIGLKKRKLPTERRSKIWRMILLNRPQSVIDGYNLWMSYGDYVEPYVIRVNKEVFLQANESYFAINAADIIELLTDQELECGILTLFEM